MEWIALVQDRDRWWVLVIEVTNTDSINCGEFIY